jgi:hypothetical protein
MEEIELVTVAREWGWMGVLALFAFRDLAPRIIPVLADERRRKIELEERRLSVLERQTETLVSMAERLRCIEEHGQVARNGIIKLLERVPDKRTRRGSKEVVGDAG